MRTADVCPTCSTYINALCVIFDGPYLTTLDINPNDDLDTALVKIETYLANNLPEGGTPTLQLVTDAGASTTNNMSIINADPSFLITDTATTRSSSVTADNILFSRDLFNLTIQTPTLTANRVLTIPDATGTIALTSDIPALIDDDSFATATASNIASAESIKAYVDANGSDDQTLQEVTTSGATTTDSFGISDSADKNISVINTTNDGRLYLHADKVNLYDNGTFNGIGFLLANRELRFSNNSNYYTSLVATVGATSVNTLTLPDTSGTVALTSDIPTDYVDLSSNQTFAGNKNLTGGELKLNDSIGLKFGTSSGLDIFHNAVNGYITIFAGDLLFRDNNLATILTLGRTTGNLTATGAVEGNTIVKTGGTSDDILLGDGTTTSFSGLGTATGLEAIDEGNGVGWRLIGRNSTNYLNIGADATDLSLSTAPTKGASGQSSFAAGRNTTASGAYSGVMGVNGIASGTSSIALNNQTTASANNSCAFGFGTIASGESSIAGGNLSEASAYDSVALGAGMLSRSTAEVSVGTFNTDYTPNSATFTPDAADRVFNVGNGVSGGRSDAFTILKNGNAGIGIDNFEANDSGATLQVDGTIQTKGYTVATLPTGVQGERAYVTDATSPTYLGALTGGGAVVCPVFHNGTAWVSA